MNSGQNAISTGGKIGAVFAALAAPATGGASLLISGGLWAASEMADPSKGAGAPPAGP